MKKGKLSAEQIEEAAWAAALVSPIIPDEVPPGWLTARQLAKKLNKPESTMGKLLNHAVVEGRAAKQSFRITSGQVTRPVPHYRIK
jgi:hypothetical protein